MSGWREQDHYRPRDRWPRRRVLQAAGLISGVLPVLAACGGGNNAKKPAATNNVAVSATSAAGTPARPAGAAGTSAPAAGTAVAGASGTTAAAARPAKEGAKVRVAIGAEPQTVDPHESVGGVDTFYLFQIFNGLMDFGYKGELTPVLAESYEVTPDGSQITFHLRKGVKFQNGDPFTSADVAYSFKRLTSPDSKGTKTPFVNVDSVQTPDDTTVIYKMKKGDAGFILGGFGGLTIVPQAYTDKQGKDGFGKVPIGTGPYKLTSRDIGKGASFDRYDGYFAGPAAFKQAQFSVIPEDSGRLNSLQVGDVDVIAAVPPALLKAAKALGGAKVIIQQSNIDTYFGFGIKDYPGLDVNETQRHLRDQRVRQALNLAVDKAGIAKNVYSTELAQPYAVTNPTQAWHLGKVYDYNTAQAKSMLSAAGASGMSLSMYHLLGGRLPALAELGAAVASNLRDAGVNVAEKGEEYNAWLSRLRNDTPPFANDGMIFSWASTAGYPDPFTGIDSKWTCAARYSQYCDPQFDSMMEKARTTFDEKQRTDLLKQAFSYMYDQAPGLWLVLIQEAYAIRTAVVSDWHPRTGSNPVIRLSDLDAA